MCHRRRHDFLKLGGDEHAGDADQLELGEGNDTRGEEAVDDVDTEEECLGEKAETDVDLD